MTRSRLALAWVGLLVWGLLLASPELSAAQEPAHRTPISFTVISEDTSVRDRIAGRIGELLAAQSGYIVRDKLPAAQLILYVNRDANDGINPNGYSIAIAHVSNADAYFLAKKLLIDKPTDDQQLKDVLVTMLNDRGMLNHLHAAHIAGATDQEIDVLSRGVVATFLEKVPANASK
jgi:hypothetical protein